MKRVITPARVIFKGSGFYATDHKSPSGDLKSSSTKEAKKDSQEQGHDHSHSQESKPADKPSKSDKSE